MTITSPFNVSVVDVTINNTYSRYYINSNYQQPNLTLFRGQSYTFNLNGTVAGSPFWIKTIASIGTGNAFNTGVTGNGSQSGFYIMVLKIMRKCGVGFSFLMESHLILLNLQLQLLIQFLKGQEFL